MKRICANADEAEVHTRWRRVVTWRRGEVTAIKRRTRRRKRREAAHEIATRLGDA